MKTNKENIQLWVNALRSGEYQQIEGRLNHNNGYCCLGVACEVAMESNINIEVAYDEDENAFCYNGLDGTLPKAVYEWFGFDHHNPKLNFGNGKQEACSYLNDYLHLNFNQIADCIVNTYISPEEVKENE